MSEQLTPEQATPAGQRRRVAPFIALGIAVVVALLFVVFARADPNKADSASTPLLFQVAPPIVGDADGVDINGGASFDLSRRKGSWVVVNFFDNTCAPCVREHPELEAFATGQDELGARGAELVTVVWGNDPEGDVEFFEDNPVEWPVVFDDGSIATTYGVVKVPETWIVSPDGVVVGRIIAEVTAAGLAQELVRLQQGAS